MAHTNNVNFGEITPLNSLMYDAAKALPVWNAQIAADTDNQFEGEDWSMKPSKFLAPLQNTIRGEAIRTVNGERDTNVQKYGSLQGLYEHYVTLRAETSMRIAYYTNLFFRNDVLDDFAPVRLLAWWNRNLNDEIEYLERHHMVDKVYEFKPISSHHNSHPDKRYFGFELSTSENISHIVAEIAILQGRDIKEVPELTSYVTSSAQKMARDKHKNYNKCLEKALTDLYKSRRMIEHMVGIDLETTGLDHTTGWIINAGWLEYDSHDEQEQIQNPQVNYYGVPKTRMKLGNPTVKVSGITTKQLKGLKPLDLDEEAQDKILHQALLKDPYVAHNAMFEHSWLMLTVAGYAENYKKGNIKIIDSIKISRRLDPYDGKKDNRLETYAKHWSVLSESEHERHLGLEDSIIMMKAMCRNLRHVGL